MANGALAKKEKRIETHGWFHTPTRPGDRTLAQQLIGLEPLLEFVPGRSVLDVGCAEGLIAMECARRGAIDVHGVEIVPGHIDLANEMRGALPCTFAVDDANDYAPSSRFDVVLLLAILHKLRDPSAACARLARAATKMCVIRMGLTGGEKIIDPRSGDVEHDIGGVMRRLGFDDPTIKPGPLGEETWFYRRPA